MLAWLLSLAAVFGLYGTTTSVPTDNGSSQTQIGGTGTVQTSGGEGDGTTFP